MSSEWFDDATPTKETARFEYRVTRDASGYMAECRSGHAWYLVAIKPTSVAIQAAIVVHCTLETGRKRLDDGIAAVDWQCDIGHKVRAVMVYSDCEPETEEFRR